MGTSFLIFLSITRTPKKCSHLLLTLLPALWSLVSITLEFFKLISLWLCGSQIHLHAVVWRVYLICKSKQTCPCLRAFSGSLLAGWSPSSCCRPNNIMVECYSFPQSPFWPLPLSHLILFCSQIFACLALYTWNVLKSLHSHLILPFPTPTHPVSTRK